MKLVIADDHPIVRQGLRAVFSEVPDVEIVADVGRAEDAVDIASRMNIDVVTMDLRFGPTNMSGVEAVRLLVALENPPAVLVLTNYDDDSDILAAVEAGARGYLLKDAPPTDLIEALRQAAAGKDVITPHVASRLIAKIRQPQVQLTRRETDVLECLGKGLSNKEMGAELFLSQPTIKSHLATLYTKLGVPSRTAAVARARELGLL